MAYICLARSDIPDGTIQILSLAPNSSQRLPAYEPEGQTRYVNRVTDSPVLFTAVGAVAEQVDGLRAYLVDRVQPAGGTWTHANQVAVSTGIIARLDAGQELLLADVNTVIQATFAASDLDGTGSTSTGVLTELLSILAGRTYRLPVAGIKGPGGAWSAIQAGSFFESYRNPSSMMVSGEISSASIGGDLYYREIGGIRHTYGLMGYTGSIGDSDLVCFSGGGPGISAPTLWPDSDQRPHYPWTFQGALTYPEVQNARVITVYGDDGSIL